MAIISERDLPELGFPELDAEHMKVISLMNKLHDASAADQPGQSLRTILDELLTFTKSHFQDEEKIMTSTGYPALSRHRDQHEELLGRLRAFQQTEDAGDPISTVSMLDFLKSWLKVHVATEDIRLVIWYRSRRGPQPAWNVL